MEAGQHGTHGLFVQSTVPGELGPDQDHALILYHNMVEMTVEVMLLKIISVIPILVQVSNLK